MDHVDIDHRVGASDRPCVRIGGVEDQRLQQIGQARVIPPRGDAGQGLWVRVGGPPLETRQGGGVVDGVLAGPRGDLQHHAAAWQM